MYVIKSGEGRYFVKYSNTHGSPEWGTLANAVRFPDEESAATVQRCYLPTWETVVVPAAGE